MVDCSESPDMLVARDNGQVGTEPFQKRRDAPPRFDQAMVEQG